MPGRPMVMVVEDDYEMNELQRELLDGHGIDSVAAYTGNQALEVYDQCHADAVIMDIMLPEMDGFEACRRLRCKSDQPLPIIIVSALDYEECHTRGQAAGANACFSKPFDPEELIETILSLIDGKPPQQ